MRPIATRISVVLACLLLIMVMGCSSGVLDCGGHGLVVLVLSVGDSTSAQVGVPLQLSVQTGVMSNGTVGDVHSLPDWGKAGLTWTTQPSDGATISSAGVFKATKPGDYLVTVSLEVGDQDDPATDWTRVTVTEAETTTTEETEAETTTTETTAGSIFAGTYKGNWLWTAGQSKADIPWAFLVDDQGALKGGFDTMLNADTRVVCVLAGQVSGDGKVDASGTADTTVSGVGSNSTPMTLTGQIASGKFTGKLVGSGGKAVDVTATLQ